MLLYTAIKGYFDGLTKLSNNELTTYKFDALAKSIKEGNEAGLRISSRDVDAYTKISGLLTKTVTDEYRKRKISNYIAEANEPVKVLLNTLKFNLVANLSRNLETKQQRLQDFYTNLLYDSTSSAYEKMKIIEDFKAAKRKIKTKENQIAAYGNSLNLMALGHQKLFENRNKLSAKDLKNLMSQYASNMEDLEDEFNKLK
jgi:hypothetical protein